MDEAARQALARLLLALADDEWILGHRDSEWTGHAPILEADIALANIAQDELGHAQIWYTLLQNISGQDPEQLVFFRDAGEFRNAQLLELPNGDWAFSTVRQYLFDAAETSRLSLLADSRYEPLAEAAAKIRPEELYHIRHGEAWMLRLGQGTPESHRRMQAALDAAWPLTGQLFISEGDGVLQEAGYFPRAETLRSRWLEQVRPVIARAGLDTPDVQPASAGRDEHTPHLEALLREMQEVARADREASW